MSVFLAAFDSQHRKPTSVRPGLEPVFRFSGLTGWYYSRHDCHDGREYYYGPFESPHVAVLAKMGTP